MPSRPRRGLRQRSTRQADGAPPAFIMFVGGDAYSACLQLACWGRPSESPEAWVPDGALLLRVIGLDPWHRHVAGTERGRTTRAPDAPAFGALGWEVARRLSPRTPKNMKRVVTRTHNKRYYRLLHLPIWIWVFFILPGNLTFDFYLRGPDRRHWMWLAAVAAVCAWRGIRGRLPGVESRPYITVWGLDQPNLAYRVVCYTAAWIDLLVPFTLNLAGLCVAAVDGRYPMAELYRWGYYPLALAVVALAWLDLLPRTRRSTRNEGVERAWFYVAIWTVVPSQVVSLLMWRIGRYVSLSDLALARARLAALLVVATIVFAVTSAGLLPRTDRYYGGTDARERIG
jgi:hypothetical protein